MLDVITDSMGMNFGLILSQCGKGKPGVLHSAKSVSLLCKELDTTEGLNNNNSLFNITFSMFSFYGYLAYFYHSKAVSYRVSPIPCTALVFLHCFSLCPRNF